MGYDRALCAPVLSAFTTQLSELLIAKFCKHVTCLICVTRRALQVWYRSGKHLRLDPP